ncbi:MAG: phage tail protein [Marinobacterium sp.]|nr:phage tail protein [Marinobacterium sp.]
MSSINIATTMHRSHFGDREMQVDIGRITEDMTEHLIGLEKQVGKAVDRSVKKVARWLRTHSVREISKELGIVQKALRRRYRVSDTGKGDERRVYIWIGLLAIAAHDAGKVSQEPGGARVRGRQFDSAFKQRIYDSEEKVYIRASANRRRGHATVTDNSVRADYGDRFPVQVVGIEIEEVGRDVLERYERRLDHQYRHILEQELNYALNVES